MEFPTESPFRRNAYRIMAFVGAVLLLGTTGYAQSSDTPSLGDLVRKQRQERQEAKDKRVKTKKVVTDEDIPEHPEESSTHADATSDESLNSDADVTPASAVAQTGEQWKAAISQQKSAIADLKSRIDKVQSSIHFVEANAYGNGVEYNKVQARKQQEVERAQNQLAEMRKNLENMQEHARRAGFGSAVWDP